jgi:hypothetical protein
MPYRRPLLLALIALGVIPPVAGACDRDVASQDENQPETFGKRCADGSHCAAPFECLGPTDLGPRFPMCTIRCVTLADCPVWEATGRCPGRITPYCTDGFCDWARCTGLP